MQITKYGHACVTLEEQGKKLIIDPGAYTPDLGDTKDIIGIVVTHVHPDHFDPANIAKILASNPEVRVWSTAEVAEQLGNPEVEAVTGGASVEFAPFSLKFFGEQHAEIHPDFPRNQNVGVLVNSSFYYPGDSFTAPTTGAQVKTLAVPVSAPWLKMGEAIDFIRAVKPQQCFPTHDAMLSDIGRASAKQWIGQVCELDGVSFTYLKPGESLEV
jgi:L-ascorbate metabolism protein UlaG (beta-lactamase superfamily)